MRLTCAENESENSGRAAYSCKNTIAVIWQTTDIFFNAADCKCLPSDYEPSNSFDARLIDFEYQN